MKPASCKGCPLEIIGEGFVPPVLPQGAKLLVVGEAPGATEARTGLPFQGRSGKLFDKLLRLMGVRREELGVANTLCCRPPNNVLRGQAWAREATERCAIHLNRAIDTARPRAILGLGETALSWLTGRTGIMRYRGFVLIGPRGIPTVSTFHPAYLLPGRTKGELRKDRPSRFLGIAALDIRKTWEIARAETPFTRTPQRYLLDPTPAEFATWQYAYAQKLQQQPDLMLTYDIETPGKQGPALERVPMLEQPILRIAFAHTAGQAVTVPWEPAYLTTIRRLLETPGDTTGWNSYDFDNLVLEKWLGGRFLKGRHYDMMRAWHVFQSDLPKKLEWVAATFTTLFPWKDLSGSNPPLYSATDGDAQIQISYALRENLQPRNQWDIVERLIRQLHEVLRPAAERGLPIDLETHTALRRQYEREFIDVLVEAQRPETDNFGPSKIYVRKPEGIPTEEVILTLPRKECTCGAIAPSVVHYRDTKKRSACPGSPVEVVREQVRYMRVLPPDLKERPFEEVLDTIKACGFNPLSVDQVSAYASSKRHLELVGATNLDDTVLTQLVRRFKDPVYVNVQKAREASKKLGTYIMGYAPDAKGLIYTTYNDNPSTLRLGSSDVNTQNVPDEIKQMVRAPKGWTILEADSSAIEAVLVGYCAKDPAYVRLAAKGVHDFLNCTALQIPFNEEGIVRSKTEFKGSRKRKKVTVHLSNYGGTPRMMVKSSPDIYPSEAEARAEQEFYFGLFPKIREWQRNTRAKAARTHVLIHEWNFHQYFHEVFDGDFPGEDYNRVLGAVPQSLAAFFMRENLLLVGASMWAEFMRANCNTHDSLALIVPTFMKDRGIAFLAETLTRPIPQLDNLRIGCEVKASADGGTWKDMDVVKTVKFEDPLALSTWHKALEGGA